MTRENVLTFWRIVKEISVSRLRRDADKDFTLGLVGSSEEITALRELLLGGQRNTREAALSLACLRLCEVGGNCDPSAALRGVAAIISLSKYRALLEKMRPPVILADEGIDYVVELVLDSCPDLILAIPRRLPAFRDEAARRVTAATSQAAAKIAIASALPGVVPLSSALLPATGLADILVLTKNQLIMLLKIAAIYGKPVNMRDQLKELLPVVGGAFGWRALARELAGAVPGGVGVVVKGVIAYAGTEAVGRGATLYYQGKRVTRDDITRLYQQAMLSGREVVDGMVSRLGRKGGLSDKLSVKR